MNSDNDHESAVSSGPFPFEPFTTQGDRSPSSYCDLPHLFETFSHEDTTNANQGDHKPRRASLSLLRPVAPSETRNRPKSMFTTFARFSQWPMNSFASRLSMQIPDVLSDTISREKDLNSPFNGEKTVPTYKSAVFNGMKKHLMNHSNDLDEPIDLEGSRLLVLLKKRKSELSESNQIKSQFKEFTKELRNIQKQSWETAYHFGLDAFDHVPSQIHWRICIELADLVKRQNLLQLSRFWLNQSTYLQPFAVSGWLEHSKLEEESGHLLQCRVLLKRGLLFCSQNESLMIKLIKLEERMGNLRSARSALSSLRHSDTEKVWKIMFEGALMEARSGRIEIARKVLEHLMIQMPWYGPIFYESFRLEEKHGNYERAQLIIEKGLQQIPRYGPLWFGAFRLFERMGLESKLALLFSQSVTVISKELVWKVHLEAALVSQREGNYEETRSLLAKSVKACPKNLRWKVWLIGSRMEILAKRNYIAKRLLNRSLQESPQKNRSMVLLECSRLEESSGNLDESRSILERARRETKYEWKVFLESVLLEIRAMDISKALSATEEALSVHPGTGRLWAILIQLMQTKSSHAQMAVFKQALGQVPKSGEVWCEGARICLDPTSPFFDLKSAQRYLTFAIKFTPQYGDSFVESLRLEFLLHGTRQVSEKLVQQCLNADPNYGAMWFRCKKTPLDTAFDILVNAIKVVKAEIAEHGHLYRNAITKCMGMSDLEESAITAEEVRQFTSKGISSLSFLYPPVSTLELMEEIIW